MNLEESCLPILDHFLVHFICPPLEEVGDLLVQWEAGCPSNTLFERRGVIVHCMGHQKQKGRKGGLQKGKTWPDG